MGGVIGPMYTLVMQPTGDNPTSDEKASNVVVLTMGGDSGFVAFNKKEEAFSAGKIKNAVVSTWDNPQIFLAFLEKLKSLGHKQVIFNPPSAPKPIDVLIGLLHGQMEWVRRQENKPITKEEVWFNFAPGDSFRVSATEISAQGLEVLLVAEDAYSNYKANAASGGAAIPMQWTDKATLTSDDPIWCNRVANGGKYVFLYYRATADQPIDIEKFS